MEGGRRLPMNTETKVRIGILVAGVAVSAFLGAAPVHGLVARVLDDIGGTTGST